MSKTCNLRRRQSRNRRNRKPFVEQLEDRRLLIASHIIAQFQGSLTNAAPQQQIPISLSSSDFTLIGSKTVFGFHLQRHNGSSLDPAAVQILNSLGNPVAGRLVTPNLAGTSRSLVIAELATGNYTLKVGADQNTRGDFQLDVFLAGNVNGDGKVDSQELAQVRNLLGVTSSGATYKVEADANMDGIITSFDYTQTRDNDNDATRVKPLTSVTLSVVPAPIVLPTGSLATNTSLVAIQGTTQALIGVALETGSDGNFDNGSMSSNGSGNYAFPSVPLQAGPNQLQARAQDGFGQRAFATVSLVFDNQAPAIAINNPMPIGFVATNPTLSGIVTDNSTGVKFLRASIDGGAESSVPFDAVGNFTFAPTIALDGSADGQHTVGFVASDFVGNVSSSFNLSFSLDTRLPTIQAFNLDPLFDTGTVGDYRTTLETVTLIGTTEANALVMLNGLAHVVFAASDGKFTIPSVSLALGNNVLSLVTVDAAGNSDQAQIIVERTAATDPVLEWNRIALEAIRLDASAPTYASRGLAMVFGSIYDAVNAIEGATGYFVTDLAAASASPEAAVASAAHRVLSYLYPRQQDIFDAALSNSLSQLPSNQSRLDGVNVGERVADAIIKMRSGDGWNDFVVYPTGATDPGQWRPTPPIYAEALAPEWADLAPFGMSAPDRFRPDGPPALGSQEYADAFNEVKDYGAYDSIVRSASQTQIARFWADGSGTFTPPGHWNRIAAEVSQSRGQSLAENARLFALLNIALADAAIVSWDAKYEYGFWRPITAIVQAAADGNNQTEPDGDWQSLIVSPPFPDYVSGHSTFSGAASEILTAAFGDNYAFSTGSSSLANITRSFTSFDQAANEAGQSRIYGGIHYQFANQDGLAAGRALADYVLQTFSTISDTIPPKIVLSNPPDLVTSQSTTLIGQVSDFLSGVAQLEARLDDGLYAPVAFTVTTGDFSLPATLALDGSDDGVHTFRLRATDNAANQSAEIEYSFTLDTRLPTLDITSPTIGATIAVGARLVGIADGTGSEIISLSYAWDNSIQHPMAYDNVSGEFNVPLDLSTLTVGGHLLTVLARDAAGNLASTSMNVSLDELIPLTVLSHAPKRDASEIGVTFRPKVEFTRAVDPTTLTEATFYATDFAGAILDTTIVPSDDGTFAWLYFAKPLPGGARITVHLDGDGIRDAAGNPVDGDFDGEPGGAYEFSFRTVSLTSLPGTTLAGIVADPGPDLKPGSFDDLRPGPDGVLMTGDDIYLLPIANAKVFVLGLEDQFVFTDDQGRFSFGAMPSGNVKLAVDGRTAFNPPAGIFFPEMVMDMQIKPGEVNNVMRAMQRDPLRQDAATMVGVYLPRLVSSILQSTSDVQPTIIGVTAGAGPQLTEQERPLLTLTIPPGVAIGEDGQVVSQPQIGISTVPVELVREMLPQGLLQHTFDITIQAPGVSVFTTPLSLTVPNQFNAAPGTQLNFLSFDHTTGRLVIEGSGTVSQDGTTISTNPGEGITHPGWTGFIPPGSPAGGGGGGSGPGSGPSGGPPCSPPPPPPTGPGATHEEAPIALPMIIGEDGMLKHDKLQWTGPGDNGPPGGCSSNPQSSLFVQIEVDGPLGEFMEHTGSQGLGTQSFGFTGSEKKSFEGKAKKYDELFEDSFDGFAEQLQDQLYGAKIKVTEIRVNGGGPPETTIRTFYLYRWVDVVDALSAEDKTGATAAFHKTLADGSGGFVRDKIIGTHLPASKATKFSTGNSDFMFDSDAMGIGTTHWRFDPESAGSKFASVDIKIDDVKVGKLEVLGTAIAPTTINLNLIGVGTQSYSEELRRVILALEEGPNGSAPVYKYTASGVSAVASSAFQSLFSGFMPKDRAGADNEFTPTQLSDLDDFISVQAVAMSFAIMEDYDPIDGTYDAYRFVPSGDGDVNMVWEDRFSEETPHDPVYGSAQFDADTSKTGDRNEDGYTLERVFQSRLLPLGAKIWMTAENLNVQTHNTGGFAIAINIDWAGNASFAEFVANTVSHEVGHTFGLKDAYSNPTASGGDANCNSAGNCTPFDIMRAGSGDDGDLTFLPQNVQLLQMAMGIHEQPEKMRHTLQQYAETINLPKNVNGVPLNRETPPSNISLPEIAMIRNTVAYYGASSEVDEVGLIPADGPGSVTLQTDYTVRNVGTADLTITGASFADGTRGFSVLNTGLAGTVLGPGQTTTLSVIFDPSLVGEAQDTLRLTSDASLAPILDLLLTGTGTPFAPTAELKLLGTGNLGGVAVAGDQSENFNFAKVTNDGVEPLLVSDIRIMQGNSAFSLLGVPVDLSATPISLALGESFIFGVRFDPTRIGIDRAFIEVTTNDAEQPTLRITVVGTGVPDVIYPDLGRDFVAIETANTPALRSISDDGGNFDFFLPDRQFYHLVVFDPETGLVGHSSGLTGNSGQFVDLTSTLVFNASTDADTDGDGLPDDVELAIGSSASSTDTDGDGVDDFLDIGRGSGLVAGASVPGVARSIVVEASRDLTSSLAYVASSPGNSPGGLYVVDVSDPSQPITVGGTNLAGLVSDVAVNTQLQMAVVPAGTSGVHLVDVSNPFRPIRRVTLIVSPEVTRAETYADRAYLTSGDDLISLDLPTRTVLETFAVGGGTLMDIGREGSTLYTIELADLTSRLRLFDVSTDAIVARGSLILPSAALGHAFVGDGILYIPSRTSDGGQGFVTIDVSNPDLPTVISGTDNISFWFASSDVAYSGSGRLLAAGAQFNQPPSLDVLDFTDPSDTDRFVNGFTLPAFPGGVAIANGFGFIAGGSAGLLVANYHVIDNLGIAPMVTISAQVSDSDLGQPGVQVSSGALIPISANVVEDVQTKHAELLLNGQVVARDLSFPFEFPFFAPQVANATQFQLQVRVTDTANNSSLSNLLTFEAVPSNLHILATFPEPDSIQTFDINGVAMAFDKLISNSSLVASNFLLVGDGGDNSFDTADDVPVVFDRVILDLTGTFPIVRLELDLPLPLDRYRVTVLADNVTDLDGNRLDGEFSGLFPTGDGTPGGNMVFTFTASRILESIPDGAFPTRRLRMVELAENEKIDDKFNTISGGALDTRGNGNVLVVDVNGDSRPDIVRPSFGTIYELNGAVTQSRTFDAVGVRVQRPDGTYDEPVNFEVGSHPRSVIAGDVNGDGFLDLVTVNVDQALNSGVTQVGFDLSILLGNGTGGFAPEIRQDTGRTIATNLFELPQVVLGQFTADTNLDLAVLMTNGAPVVNFFFEMHTELLLFTGNADGSFVTPVSGMPLTSQAFDRRRELNAVDINGDSLLDLIAPEQILIGDGNGNFADTLVPGDVGTRVIAVADVTLDGKNDLLTELYPGFVTTLRLLQNDGFGNFTPITSAANQATPAKGEGVIADINGDTFPDWIVPNSNSSISVHLGNANFTFQQFVRLPLSALLGTARGFVNVAAADFNSDSVMDLITTRLGDEAAIIVAGQSDGTLDLPTDSLPRIGGPGTFPIAHSRLMDMTGDDILDLVGDGLTVYRSNGDGTFAPPVITSSPGVHFAFGPIDADTIPDAVVTNGAGNVVLQRGLGNGSFGVPINVAALGPLGFGTAVSIEVLDATGDGLLDIAVAHTMGITIIPGNGDGTFDAPVHTMTAASISFSRTLVVLDANNDNREDLAVPMGGLSDALHILLGNANGTLTDFGTFSGPIGRQSKFASADFDDDGNADLVVATADNTVGYMGQLLYFKGLGDGTFNPAARIAVDDYVDVLAVDVDGNGTQDLITAGLYEFSVYSGVGDGTFAAPTRFDLSATPSVLLVGDVTDDSLVDIVAYEYLHVQNTPPATFGMLNVGMSLRTTEIASTVSPTVEVALNPLDINGDKSVTPLDALLVINYLNNLTAGRSQVVDPFDFDVNQDRFVSPLDALWIINFLNSQSSIANDEISDDGQQTDTFFDTIATDEPKEEGEADALSELIGVLAQDIVDHDLRSRSIRKGGKVRL